MGNALTPGEKMKRYRQKMRVAGLRPVQVWVPDVKAPGFLEEARKQSLRVQGNRGEQESLDFIESIVDLDGWQ